MLAEITNNTIVVNMGDVAWWGLFMAIPVTFLVVMSARAARMLADRWWGIR